MRLHSVHVGPRRAPGGSKSAPDGPNMALQTAQIWPKTAPRRSNRRPGGPKAAPRGPQGSPKSTPRECQEESWGILLGCVAPNMPPRPSRKLPGRSQEAPRGSREAPKGLPRGSQKHPKTHRRGPPNRFNEASQGAPAPSQEFEPLPRCFFVRAGLLVDSTIGTGLERQETHNEDETKNTRQQPSRGLHSLFLQTGPADISGLRFWETARGNLARAKMQHLEQITTGALHPIFLRLFSSQIDLQGPRGPARDRAGRLRGSLDRGLLRS